LAVESKALPEQPSMWKTYREHREKAATWPQQRRAFGSNTPELRQI
jgi:hypothetical protein